MKNAGIAAALVLAILAVVFVGTEVLNLDFFFGGILPYIAMAVFIIGFIYRVLNWAKSPVPFRIPTTAGQQKSLDFIKQNKIDNPSTKAGVIVRMFLEVVFFRSLFRNSKAEVTEEGNITYQWEKWLWLFGLCFHWGFFLTVFRHLRLFTDPVPGFVKAWEIIDGAFWVDLQQIYLTGFILLLGITGLIARRLYLDKVRYVSLVQDFFPIFLIFGIAVTGITDQITWDKIVAAYEPAIIRVGKAEPIEIIMDPGQIFRKGDGSPYIYLLQGMLTQLSLDHPVIISPGNSGFIDERTSESISGFQSLAGLPVTGELDKITWKHIVRQFTLNAHHNTAQHRQTV